MTARDVLALGAHFRSWGVALACCSAVACGTRSDSSHFDREQLPAGALPLIVDLRIGSVDGAGTDGFTDIRGLAIDSAGRIYVLELSTKEVRVLDQTGAFVARWGRQGHGPGEFQDPVGIVIDRKNHLWVVDQGNSRFSSFTLEGHYLTSFPRLFPGSNVEAWRGTIDSSGWLIDVLERPFPASSTLLMHFSVDRPSEIDSIALPPYAAPAFELLRGNSRTRAIVPFAPRLEWVIDPRGAIWLGASGIYSIVRLSFSGDTIANIRQPDNPPPVRPEERAEAIKRLDWFVKQGGMVDPSRIPDRKPAFRRLTVDELGRLWVQVEADVPEDVAVFDIFDPQGHHLGRVTGRLGTMVRSPVFARGRLFAVVADSDGVESIVRAVVPILEPRM